MMYAYFYDGQWIEGVTGFQIKGFAKSGLIQPNTQIRMPNGKEVLAEKISGLEFQKVTEQSIPESFFEKEPEEVKSPSPFHQQSTSVAIPESTVAKTTANHQKPGILILAIGLSIFVISHVIISASLFHQSAVQKGDCIVKIAGYYDDLISEKDNLMSKYENIRIPYKDKNDRDKIFIISREKIIDVYVKSEGGDYTSLQRFFINRLTDEVLDNVRTPQDPVFQVLFESEKLFDMVISRFKELLEIEKEQKEIRLEKTKKIQIESDRFFPIHIMLSHLFVSVFFSAFLGIVVKRFW